MNAARVRMSVAVLVSIFVHGAIAWFVDFSAGRAAVSDRMRPMALTIASNAQVTEQQQQAAAVSPAAEHRTPAKKSIPDEAAAAKTEVIIPDVAVTQPPPPLATSPSIPDEPRDSSDIEPDDTEPATMPEIVQADTMADAATTANQQPQNTSNDAAATNHARSGNIERLPLTEKPDVTAVPLYHLIPKPNYPSRARDLGEEGMVIIAVYVGDDGAVLDAYVSESSGYPLLDGSALATVLERWRFKPGIRRGTAVSSWVRVPIKFSIKGS